MSPRILVTGSRDWEDRDMVFRTLMEAWEELGSDPETELMHGACPTGADQIADEMWSLLGWPLLPRPALWNVYHRAAGPLRNQHMVSLGADLCLAFILPGSRGAAGCAKLAETAGIPTRRFP